MYKKEKKSFLEIPIHGILQWFINSDHLSMEKQTDWTLRLDLFTLKNSLQDDTHIINTLLFLQISIYIYNLYDHNLNTITILWILSHLYKDSGFYGTVKPRFSQWTEVPMECRSVTPHWMQLLVGWTNFKGHSTKFQTWRLFTSPG